MATMRIPGIWGIILLTITICSLSLPVQAQYSGGTGEPNDPCQIATAEDLILLGENPDDYDKHFVLTADIDLNPNLPGRNFFDRAVIAPDVDPTDKWGTFQGMPFTGVFDGNDHTISHLTVTGEEFLGLFGRLGSGATVRNLALVDVNITSLDDYYVGGLAGYSSGHVTHCYSTGTINGDGWVGGLVGANEGGQIIECSSNVAVRGHLSCVGGLVGSNVKSDVIHCHVTGTVNGRHEVGGIVGANSQGSILNCYNTATVNGDGNVGGLVGENYKGSVTGCKNRGRIGGDENIGGLVGFNNFYSDVTYCANASPVDGGSSVGGLVGLNNYGPDVTCCYSTSAINGSNMIGGLVGTNRGSTSNCYATGPATGNRDVGGLVGYNYTGTITNCYSAGLVTGAGSVGGLIGSNDDGQITHSFWNIQTSHRTTSAGGTGKNTAQMYTAEIFLDIGWDFVGERENGEEDIWWILESQGYPELAWNFWAASLRPENGATDVLQPLILTWVVGKYPIHHHVYFGEDEEAVANATTESQDVYRGLQPIEMTIYDPGVLEYGKTYYWRIDEVNKANAHSPWKGKVWDFTTADFILVLVVDDFEIYPDNPTSPRIFQIWIDGLLNPDNGSQVGYLLPPYTEKEIVHGGLQSMPLFYDNTGSVRISEAVRTFGSDDRCFDWTINDADTLTLFFRGEADNDPDTLYMAIEDRAGRMAVAMHPDADALLTTEWQKWHVSLVDMQAASVDLTTVSKIYIGVGDRDNPQPGGAGKIYIDDIWVTNRMP